MHNKITAGLLVVAVSVMFGCAKHRPRDKELEALKLLGSAADVPWGISAYSFGAGLLAECGASTDQVKKEANLIVDDWLKPDFSDKPPIALGLPAAATKLSTLAKQCSKFELGIVPTARPDINKVIEVLGKEDSVDKTAIAIGENPRNDIFNHRFGWIHIWVLKGQVHQVHFDFKNSGY